MTCLVIDDEESSIRHLVENNIKKIPYLTLLGAFTNPQQAVVFLQTNTVDLIFLDVEMPNYNIDGIDFMKINRPDQRYILVTAHPEYALESYEYNVIDYLRKPFPFERFARAVQKAQQVIKSREEPVSTENSLYVKAEGKLQRVFFDQVGYVEADRNYATIYLASGSILTKKTLVELEEQFPVSLFFRVHKSYIIAVERIQFLEKNQIGIALDGTVALIPLGSQYKKSFFERIDTGRLPGKGKA